MKNTQCFCKVGLYFNNIITEGLNFKWRIKTTELNLEAKTIAINKDNNLNNQCTLFALFLAYKLECIWVGFKSDNEYACFFTFQKYVGHGRMKSNITLKLKSILLFYTVLSWMYNFLYLIFSVLCCSFLLCLDLGIRDEYKKFASKNIMAKLNRVLFVAPCLVNNLFKCRLASGFATKDDNYYIVTSFIFFFLGCGR